MKRLFAVLFIAIATGGCAGKGENVISLTGSWRFALDPQDRGRSEQWQQRNLDPHIHLPGTTDEAGLGEKITGSEPGALTRVYKYIGPAWYQKTITIPPEWKGKKVELFLERVIWETTVWVDDRAMGRFDSLATPHRFLLGELAPGDHTLTIRVDNSLIYNIGDKGHSYGDHMQTIWNGIVGHIELRCQDRVHLKQPRLTSDLDKGILEVQVGVVNQSSETKGTFAIEVVAQENGQTALRTTYDIDLGLTRTTLNVEVALNDKIRLWSEFDPAVYRVDLTLQAGRHRDTKRVEYGFRKIDHDGTHVLLNGKKAFLRGNLDNCHFPLTGYPAMDVAGWERIFRILKSYGLNHVRFHSWCPPEAALIAGNRVGIYLQLEAGIWIDGWMKGRTTFKPEGLGVVPEVDEFVQNEMRRIVDAYGNHPSFVMMAIGNELGSSDFSILEKWIADLKAYDPRRLYAASTARAICPSDDYAATHHLPGAGGTRGLRGGKSNWDFDPVVSQADIPVIAHELGQWPVYPDWTEIEKYTGTLRARNLEEFRGVAERHGIAGQHKAFRRATGTFSQLLYKYEIESVLRSSQMAGFHLLGLQDYSGQGEALIGILDSFYDSKGIIEPQAYRRFCNTVVPLVRLEKFVWQRNESLAAEVEVANYGPEAIKDASVAWVLKNPRGLAISRGRWEPVTLEQGAVTPCGEINVSLGTVQHAAQCMLEVQIESAGVARFANDWSIWVYPEHVEARPPKNVTLTDRLDETAFRVLDSGGRVLFDASRVFGERIRKLHYMPVYWSARWFAHERDKQLGLVIQDNHPALKDFPTSYHSDWQWELGVSGGVAIVLNDLDKGLKPIIQPVDNFHVNDKLGSLFEVRVGQGRLLVSGIDISHTKGNPVKRQLRHSLLNYVNGDSFLPTVSLPVDKLRSTFDIYESAESTVDSFQFERTVLHVKAAAKLQQDKQNIPWRAELDEVAAAKGFDYRVETDGTWKEGNKTAWHADEMVVTMQTPPGWIGTLYVWFHDWSNNDRLGLIDFEGRKYALGQHAGQEGQWLEFHVMREDTLDDNIILKCDCRQGPNLHIREIVLVSQE